MPIMKSTDIVAAYKGNNPISKILLGDTLVWPREPLLEFDCVGTGQLLDMTVTNTTGYVGVVVDDTQLQIFSKTSETQYTVLQAQGSGYNKNYPIASSYKVNCKLALFKKRVIAIEKRNSDNQRYVADTSVGSIKAVLQNPFATNFNVSISLTGRGTQTHSLFQNQIKSISFTGLSSGTYTITITDNDTGAVSSKALSVGIGNRWSIAKYAIDFGEYTSTSTIPTKVQVYPLTESEALALAFGNGCVIRMHAKEGKKTSSYRTSIYNTRIEFVLYTGGSGYPPNERIPVSTSNISTASNDNIDPYAFVDLITDETGTVVDVKKSANVYGSYSITKRGDSIAEMGGYTGWEAGRFFHDVRQVNSLPRITNLNQSYEDYIINGSPDLYNPTPFNTCQGFSRGFIGWGINVFQGGFVGSLSQFREQIDIWKNNAFFTSGPAATANSPRPVFINGDKDGNNILGGSDGLISQNTLASAQGLVGKTTSISIGSVPVQRIKAQSQQELVAIQSDSYGTYDNLRSNRPDTVNISGSKKIEALHSSYVAYNYLRVIGTSAKFGFWIKHINTNPSTRRFEITRVVRLDDPDGDHTTNDEATLWGTGYSSQTTEYDVTIPSALDYYSRGVYTNSGGNEGELFDQPIVVNRQARISMWYDYNGNRPNVSLVDGGSYTLLTADASYDDLIGDWGNDIDFMINPTYGQLITKPNGLHNGRPLQLAVVPPPLG